MATTSQRLVVADAGPIIHLDELSCLDLLEGLGTILIPQPVLDEVLRHRPNCALERISSGAVNRDLVIPSVRLRVLASNLSLGNGEVAAIALLESLPATVLLCDDAAARLAAESLGFTVHGSIGILVRSIRRGTRDRSAVLDMLRDLPDRSTLHISRHLLAQVITEVEQR